MKSRKSYCTTPGSGVGGGGGGISKKFNVKVFYVMGKALSGELSCPCDRSCLDRKPVLSADPVKMPQHVAYSMQHLIMVYTVRQCLPTRSSMQNTEK